MSGDMLDTAAVSVHEMFSAYVRAGFTRAEALQIVIATLVNAHNNGQQTPESDR